MFRDVADVLDYSKAQGIDKLVFICLANYTDENHTSWPSIGKLAKDAGVADRTIQRSIDSLIDLGELTKEQRQRENGSSTSNAYRVSVCHPPPSHKVTPPVSESHPQILSYEPSSSLSSKDKKRVCAVSAKPNKEEVIFFVTSMGLTKDDGEQLYDSWLANGFRTKTGPIKDWEACARNWKRSGWFGSQQKTFHIEQSKKNGHKPDIFDRPPSPPVTEEMLARARQIRKSNGYER